MRVASEFPEGKAPPPGTVRVRQLEYLLEYELGQRFETVVRQPTGRFEVDDEQQMIAAQNEYRRRRGAPELTEDDANAMAREDEAIRERARRSHEGRLDELEDEYGV